jgi:multiple sugar transport system permease protein
MNSFFRRKSIYVPSPAGRFFSYLVLVFWSFVVLFPIYWLVVTSFKLPIQVASGPFYIPFVDFQPSLDAWHYIFVDLGPDTFRPYLNTVVVAITSASLALALGTAASYALTRFDYHPKLGVIGLFIGCVALSIVAI